MGHRSIFNSDSDTSIEVALGEGVFARTTGQPACLNPYVGIACNTVDLSKTQHAEWLLCCRAWWKGWDDEETRLRPRQPTRHGFMSVPREGALPDKAKNSEGVKFSPSGFWGL